MSERIEIGRTGDYREPPLPTKYRSLCPACGTYITSMEHDGYCARCATPQRYAALCEEKAARIGWTLLLNIDDPNASLDSIHYAAKTAAHYAREAMGEGRAAA